MSTVFKSWRTHLTLGAATAGLMILASSCGGSGTVTSAIIPVTPTPTCQQTNTCYVPSPLPSPSIGTGEFSGAIQVSFSLNGTNSGNTTYTTGPITTDNLLKVRLTALAAGVNNVQGTNYTASYDCAGFTISAAGDTQTSQALGVNGSVGEDPTCGQNGSQQVFDFSPFLNAGHGAITITVSNPEYDYYCLLWLYGWIAGTETMYCPLHPVYQYHTVNGMLEIETNSTAAGNS